MATTRKQLRRDVLQSLGDLRILTATYDSQSDVEFIDTVHLDGEVGAYVGRETLFTAGSSSNLGEIRYITGSSSQRRAIGFAVSLPTTPVVGDECEMLNTRGIGFRIQDVHEMLNTSIANVASQSLVVTGVEQSSYTRGDEITLPDNFQSVENVQWLDWCDTKKWHSIPKSPRPNGNGWWVDRANRTLQISGRPGWRIADRTLKIWGLAEPAELLDDDDETTIDREWLAANTTAMLLRAKHFRMPTPETERLMYMMSQAADAKRRKVIIRRSPWSESL